MPVLTSSHALAVLDAIQESLKALMVASDPKIREQIVIRVRLLSDVLNFVMAEVTNG